MQKKRNLYFSIFSISNMQHWILINHLCQLSPPTRDSIGGFPYKLKIDMFHHRKNLHMQKKKSRFFNFDHIKYAALNIEKSSVLTIPPDEGFYKWFSVQIKNRYVSSAQKLAHAKKKRNLYFSIFSISNMQHWILRNHPC